MLSKKEYQNVKAFMEICKKYLPEDFKNSAEYIDSLFPPIEEEFDYEGIKHNRPSITSRLNYRVKEILYNYTNSSNVSNAVNWLRAKIDNNILNIKIITERPGILIGKAGHIYNHLKQEIALDYPEYEIKIDFIEQNF